MYSGIPLKWTHKDCTIIFLLIKCLSEITILSSAPGSCLGVALQNNTTFRSRFFIRLWSVRNSMLFSNIGRLGTSQQKCRFFCLHFVCIYTHAKYLKRFAVSENRAVRTERINE